MSYDSDQKTTSGLISTHDFRGLASSVILVIVIDIFGLLGKLLGFFYDL